GERGAPVSPPAAGRGCKEAGSSLGGCPASCPDAHRPTHGHRHVRNWAIRHLSDSAHECKHSRRVCYVKYVDFENQRASRCWRAMGARVYPVNGSTLRAARMKLAMMTSPSRKKID